MGVLVYVIQWHSWQKQPNLKLKTQPKQLVGFLPLGFALPTLAILNILIFLYKQAEFATLWTFTNFPVGSFLLKEHHDLNKIKLN